MLYVATTVICLLLVFNEHEYDIFIKHKNNSIASYSVFEGDTTYKKVARENVFAAIKDWRVLIFGLTNLCCLTILYNNSLFLPSIIKGFGFTALNAQLLTIPPNFIGKNISASPKYLKSKQTTSFLWLYTQAVYFTYYPPFFSCSLYIFNC